jgi:hypothetical protein
MKSSAYLGVVALVFSLVAPATAAPDVLVAGTRLHFRLDQTLSSDRSTTGQAFTFVLTAPVKSRSGLVLPAGSMGSGTVYLAGHAGSAGHEGDLTLRLDWLRAPLGRYVNFADQRFEINGTNRKIASAVLGFVPFVGLASRFVVRGKEVEITPSTPIETVLERPAPLKARAAVPKPPPSLASPTAQPTTPPTPVPTAVPTAFPSAAPTEVPSALPSAPPPPAATIKPTAPATG